MNHVTRFNLKTACSDRSKLIDFCLKGKEQFLAIGWSYIYKKVQILRIMNHITMQYVVMKVE